MNLKFMGSKLPVFEHENCDQAMALIQSRGDLTGALPIRAGSGSKDIRLCQCDKKYHLRAAYTPYYLSE
jgi:hypothetical protein